MQIIIPGPPIPKARPKFSSRGKFMKAYDPQKMLSDQIILLVKPQITRFFDQGQSLIVEATFHTTLPISVRSRQRKQHSWGILNNDHKPDLDNMIKFYLDLLNGIAYEDDRQIVELNVKKIYSNIDKTVIEIMPKQKHEEAIAQFAEVLSLDEFHDLASRLFDISCQMKLYVQENEPPNAVHSALALKLLGQFSSKFGKQIVEIAKKNKKTIEKISDNSDQQVIKFNITTNTTKPFCC